MFLLSLKNSDLLQAENDISTLNSKMPKWNNVSAQVTHSVSPTAFDLLDNGYVYYLFGSYYVGASSQTVISLSVLPKATIIQSDYTGCIYGADASILSEKNCVFEIKDRTLYLRRQADAPGRWYAGSVIIPHA